MNGILALGGVATVGIALAVAVALVHLHHERRPASPPPTVVRPSAKIPSVPRVASVTGERRSSSPLAAPPTTPDDEMDWLAQAADELHTPLTTLRDQVRFLRQHASDASRTALITVAERLVYQVEQLDSLIEAWSATARHTGPQRIPAARPVELVTLTRRLTESFATPGRPPAEIVAPTPLWVLMDPQAIERALSIALTSAHKAASAYPVEAVLRQVTLRDRTEVSIAIADRRAGPLAAAQDVWEALELDLARVLLEEYGGRLERTPRGGGGAITTIWLPATVLIRLPGHRDVPTFTRLAKTA